MKNVLVVVGFLIVGFIAYSFYGDSGGPVVQDLDGAVADVEPIDYSISVQATPISAYVVSLVVTTNIPLPVEVMAGVSAKGQAPTDTFIGVSERVMLTSPEQTIEMAQFTNRMRSWHVLFQIRGIGRLWITSSFRIGYLG